MARNDGNKSYYYLLSYSFSQADRAFKNNGDKGILRMPLNFIRSGSFSDGLLSNRKETGRYWEFKIYSQTGARFLYFVSNGINPQNNNYKGLGFSVHCVAKLFSSM